MNRHIWQRQAPLSEHFQIVTWDLPGHGENLQTDKAISLTSCAEALHQLIQKLALTKITYVGWSMGMSVLWRYLELYNAKPFHQIVNIEMLPWMDAKEAMVDGVRRSIERDRERATRKFVGRVFPHSAADEIEPFVQAALSYPVEGLLDIYQEMAESDFREVAQSLEVDQQIILGRAGFYQQREAEFQKTFPEAQLQWIDDAGHAPFWEQAEAFNQLFFTTH